MFQHFALFPWKTVRRTCCTASKSRACRATRAEQRAREFIDLVGLRGFEDSYPSQLSGGMKQRAASPAPWRSIREILLMDEPFGALDAQTRSLMQGELLQHLAALAKTVIFVTHDVQEAVYPRRAHRGDVGAAGPHQGDRRDQVRSRAIRMCKRRPNSSKGRRDVEPGPRRGDQGAADARGMTAVSPMPAALYAAAAARGAWETVTRAGLVPLSALPPLDRGGRRLDRPASERRSLANGSLRCGAAGSGWLLAIVFGA